MLGGGPHCRRFDHPARAMPHRPRTVLVGLGWIDHASPFNVHALSAAPRRLTVCVTCVWAGVDSAWEQEKLEAEKCLKMPQNPIRQVHALLARFVCTMKTLCLENSI